MSVWAQLFQVSAHAVSVESVRVSTAEVSVESVRVSTAGVLVSALMVVVVAAGWRCLPWQ